MSRKPGILLIDANDWDREQVRGLLDGLSTQVTVVPPRELESPGARVDVIILGFTDAVSLQTARSQLDTARARFPQAQLILCAPPEMKGLDNRVIELKARAFLLKPVEEETFVALLDETLAQIRLRREREAYERTAKSARTSIVGESEAIGSVLGLLERVAESATTSVLLLGESGVGKGLFAQSVHDMCEHTPGPFIEINCAALPASLLESELFGYEPGAFTDARTQKIGLIELADGGTLFLDEITEIDLTTQAKLLKFLDAKKLRRLGGDREIAVDVRIVAATNRDLRAEVAAGNFREDLFYRLNVVEIRIPSLRERGDDIDLLARHYLDYFRKKFNKLPVEMSAGAWALVRAYPWPGNVRELINVIERAVLLVPGDTIEAEHLPIERRSAPRQATVSRDAGSLSIDLPDGAVGLEEIERAVVVEMLRRTRGNVSRAAELLGMSRGALRNRISRHRIDARRFARPAFAESGGDG